MRGFARPPTLAIVAAPGYKTYKNNG